ncbi:MAG: hypothetical protein AAF899_01955 [Pseudomonadota bacterium]
MTLVRDKHVGHWVRVTALTVAVISASGCARALLEETPVELKDEPTRPGADAPAAEAVMAAIGAVIEPRDAARTLRLCDADRETGACFDDEDSLSAFGVGGLLLPLILEVDGVDITSATRNDEGGWLISSDFDLTVNEIPPLCPDADGTISLSETGTLSLSFDAFYCNWIIIGNVITQIDFMIDMVDTDAQAFTGEYAIQFNGTGNAFGSGYFRAEALDEAEGEPLASRLRE